MALAAPQTSHIALAQTLHPRLLHLFTRWPPTQEAMAERQRVLASEDIKEKEIYPSPLIKSNPFMPWKNPNTGRWHGAHYSLRRQAELFRLAKKYDVLPLMPLSPKHPEMKAKKLRHRHGPMRTNADGGLRVKGKKWERQLESKTEKRTAAIIGMPALIKQWRLSGNGKGWKKWPK